MNIRKSQIFCENSLKLHRWGTHYRDPSTCPRFRFAITRSSLKDERGIGLWVSVWSFVSAKDRARSAGCDPEISFQPFCGQANYAAGFARWAR